jgi:hypothetical protein
VIAAAWVRKLPQRAGAIALDRHHDLKDRLSSALSFGDMPQGDRTPFMDAAIDDALGVVKDVQPRRAVPMKAPRDLGVAAALGVAVAFVALFEVREHKLGMSQKTIDPVEVSQDDIDAFQKFLQEQEQKNQSDEAKDATREFNQLLKDLADKRIDRTDAFRRMQQLEDKLQTSNPQEKKALEDALQKMGEDLKKSDLTKPAGESLDNKNLKDAEKNFHELAKKMRDGKVDKDQLDKMREALKQASENAAKNKDELEKKRDELKKETDLLKKKEAERDGGAMTDQEKDLLQKKERELERLDQQAQQAAQNQRSLDKLDSELQKAAEDLMHDLGASANDLDQGAEDLDRMAQQEMTDQEKEELKQKLQELRELLRQQGQGGHQQMVRLQRFQQHARGNTGGQGGQGGQNQGPTGQGSEQGGDQGQQGQGQGQQGQGQGQQGQGQQGQGQGGQGQQGQGGQGQGGQGQGGQGQGQGGQGQGGQGQSEVWVVGPNGEKILMLTRGGQGQGGQGQGQGGQGGQGGHGPGWGTGHDSNIQGGATNPKVGTQDTQVSGQDTGQGQTRSQVILGAAERGFANRGYTKVYREYHTVAEEALNKDEIPGGYRFYVRRYFQLIRPRDGQE